jgi:hypothetical protein
MLLKGKSNTLYEARILSEKKVPKFVRGNYITKNISIDGNPIEFKWDKDRLTGLYFRLNGKPLYFAEREILKEKSLERAVREPKSRPAEESEIPTETAE